MSRVIWLDFPSLLLARIVKEGHEKSIGIERDPNIQLSYLQDHYQRLVREGRMQILYETLSTDRIKIGVFDTIVIGQNGDIRTNLAISIISNKHCSIARTMKGWELRDEYSRNGSVVRRRFRRDTIIHFSTYITLAAGDKIFLGTDNASAEPQDIAIKVIRSE